jgi:putative SOS response-associated peptidase YedK
MVGRAAAANELVGQIRDRMPLILAREDYGRWPAAGLMDSKLS